jgi:putative ABC transport system ATP-binding protein
VPDRFLAVENACVSYGEAVRTPVLSDLSLSFEKGKLTLILGPSGSGKTTLLSLLGCLLTPDEGEVYVGGKQITRLAESDRTKLRRHIGFIFQAFRLFRSLSVTENIALGEEVIGRADGRERVQELLRRFDLLPKAGLKPSALSGGEKQRVAIARALIKDPAIILADEPTASLDSAAGQQISEILFRLAEEQGRTVVVVSHDPRWERFAHHIVALSDGSIAQQWSTNACI